MADLTTTEKQILEHLFGMDGGYVLDFSYRTIEEFFADGLGIDFFDEKYNYASGSKANRMRKFWQVSDNKLVAKCILKLLERIETNIFLGDFHEKDYPNDRIKLVKKIAERLKGGRQEEVSVHEKIIDEKITVVLNEEVFAQVQDLLSDGYYSSAIEEAYKIVREKLKEITGTEKAHEAFKGDNYDVIFGHTPTNAAEEDRFEGIKFLHMAIQKLRNERAHTPAKKIDENLAIHYIVLASLAYKLIDRN